MATMKLSEFTQALVNASEKAARIARAVRSEEALFGLLVEEKTGEQKNKRFVEDFKTLADVLVQETVKYDLGKRFVGIADNIFGEECNQFTNTLGEMVEMTVQENIGETTSLLARVLDGNEDAASLLAAVVHEEVIVPTECGLEDISTDLDVDSVGVWIDPIDSTAQYIHGYESSSSAGVYSEGLPCVVVLIGAYDINTGMPIVGVVNQPFSSQDSESRVWQGRICWGLNWKDHQLSSIPAPSVVTECNQQDGIKIVMSSSEDKDIQSRLSADFDVCYAAGAGYKVLCVADKVVDAYILSGGSTFKWDTCSPHALLLSQKGSILDFHKALDVVRNSNGLQDSDLQPLLESCSLIYKSPDDEDVTGADRWANSGGIIAYRDSNTLLSIIKSLLK